MYAQDRANCNLNFIEFRALCIKFKAPQWFRDSVEKQKVKYYHNLEMGLIAIIVMKTKIINLFGGPNCGKSTIASGLFYNLKIRDINSELISEYAKIKVWEGNEKTLKNQIYLFAKQHFAIHNVLGLVDFIIMDSPLLLNPIYDKQQCEIFKTLCLSEHNKLNNINFFINRNNKKFEESGRIHTLTESEKLDSEIKEFLKNNNIKFYEVTNLEEILEKLKNFI